jgi:superfamily II DNA or RNA helicase
MRNLISEGYLCKYRIFAPPMSMNMAGVAVSSSTGDYNQAQMRREAHRSRIVGDVVGHYLRIAPGKRNVVFAVDVELAHEHAAAFRAAGISAEVLHAKTKDTERVSMLDRFERGETSVIVNVDVLGEGFDCPAIECVQFARPTVSWNLFVQQFGRGLRILPGKASGTIIDHVGNVQRHGLPDAPQEFSLDGIAKKPKRADDDLPVRTCLNPKCFSVFEGYGRTCPFCGDCPPRESASRPEQVEGDLVEYSPELLAQLQAKADEIMKSNQKLPMHMGKHVVKAVQKKQAARRDAQIELRDALAWWGGTRRDRYGDEDSDAYRRFFRTFGVDVMTARTFGTNEATELHEKIWRDIARMKEELGG